MASTTKSADTSLVSSSPQQRAMDSEVEAVRVPTVPGTLPPSQTTASTTVSKGSSNSSSSPLLLSASEPPSHSGWLAVARAEVLPGVTA